MTLHVHRAERADTLAAGLADLLDGRRGDPFAVEVVAVPTKGVERWLTQRLSHRLGARAGRDDGICAAVRFPHPAILMAELMADLGGSRDDDPWAPDAVVWPLLEVIDEAAGEPWCALLAAHLGYRSDAGATGPEADHRRDRRYAVARRIAGLIDGYATHRPDMLDAWSRGQDTDGWGDPVPPDLAWQPRLWRRLRERIPAPDPVAAWADVRTGLVGNPAAAGLPDRISMFGPTALPARQLRLLVALAVHRDVHLWLPHPSPALWNRVRAGLDGGAVPVKRRGDPTVAAAAHPLLASLGRDVRELQVVLAGHIDHDRHHAPAGPGTTDGPATLLRRLQQGLAANTGAPAAPAEAGRTDDSIRVHACHGQGRQVDVLRDVVVGLLADDPTLHPADILVMCPDVESFAPLLQGAFGLAESVPGGHPAHQLRVRLADRALRQTNPVLAALERILDLAGRRVTASELLDLAAFGPVRHRFGFDDDELAVLAGWVNDAGARWGLDAAHRARFGLADFPHNTWRAGLDRILLGACMSDEPGNRLATALPLDEVGSADVDLAGRLAELVARLGSAVDALSGRHPVAHWCATLLDCVQSLTSVPPRAAWQLAELRVELAAVEKHAAVAGSARVALGLADIRALLAGALAGRPTRANFRTGTLTVCTMMPMRSVPHRVVILLGLDDGVFPRAVREDGDDLLTREPACGERDLRSEDRQLMLDAVVAATDKLIITYTGADERTGAPRPPAVPLGELLDALDDIATVDGGPVRRAIEVRHPLQPFDPRTVTAGALGRAGPFTFDPVALGGARSLGRPRRPSPSLVSAALPGAPLAEPGAGDIELSALIDLLVHPAKGFLRQRLEVAVPFDQDDPPDDMPVDLDDLARWQVGDRMLRQRLAGVPEAECCEAERRRGVLPPANLGGRALQRVLDDVRPLVDRTVSLRGVPPRTVEVSVPLPGGRRLRGTVGGVHGRVLVAVSYSRLGARARLQSWLALLALTATDPGVGWSAATVGRAEHGHPQCATLPALATPGPADRPGDPGPGELAAGLLADLVELYLAGLSAPLPLPVKTAERYAAARHRGADHAKARDQAATAWVGNKFPGENQEPANVQVWGRDCGFADLQSGGAVGSVPGLVIDRAEPDPFAALALRVWRPVLRHETRGAL